ncbi:hypothetical protein ACBY01_04320 [Sphingomonas sp. ac-8]|uniref:hypothetical protein n=1 Tax=Sphingomonas sp. ac-8 TaxID=3242977 RepID=UPI003A80473B
MATLDLLAPTLHAAVAGELRLIGALLERLAETLVGDEHFSAHYLDQLQTFDLIIQCADESASVLDRLSQGVDPYEAIAPVRLTAVQDRLRDALALAQAA